MILIFCPTRFDWPADIFSALLPECGTCKSATVAVLLQPVKPAAPRSKLPLTMRLPGIFPLASISAAVWLRLLLSFVRESPCALSVLPCSVTWFCRVFIALASAFLFTFAFVVARSLLSLVSALLATAMSFPCCVTVPCSCVTAVVSAFLLTVSFVDRRLFSSEVVRVPMLLSVSPCWLTVVVSESTAFAVASAVFCALFAAVTLRICQSAAYQTVPNGLL